MTEDSKSLDILGIKPIADSVNTVTKGSVDGASAFLGRICLPAAEEFGLLIKDKVSAWRAANMVKITTKAQALVEKEFEQTLVQAHPRIIYSTIENGSWVEDDFMQNMWAGLLASSCTEHGKDESNLILIGLLSQITSNQSKLIKYICENAEIYQTEAGWIGAGPMHLEAEQLIEIMEVTDLQQVDIELDHLRGLELIVGGFDHLSTQAEVSPHSLCLQLYVRSQGYVGCPNEYFNAPVKTEKEIHALHV